MVLSSLGKIAPLREAPADLSANQGLVSIVIPIFNESANLPALWSRLRPVMENLGRGWEVIFVDDGSKDDSLEILRRIGQQEPARVRVVELARNFGQHAAILAGFSLVRGEMVVTLDADLQNPPEEIPRLVKAIDDGNDVVGGWREDRQDEGWRKYASHLHNRLTSLLVGVPMHDYGCMLRAYRRQIVDTVVQCDEKAAFIPALANSFAKRVTEIRVKHDPRASGKSRYNLLRLATLSLNLITGYSLLPIQTLSLAGIVIFLLDALMVMLLVLHRFIYGPQQEGALWLLFAMAFLLFGFVFLALGLLGEHVGRIHVEVRHRPTYIIRSVEGAGPEDAPGRGESKAPDDKSAE